MKCKQGFILGKFLSLIVVTVILFILLSLFWIVGTIVSKTDSTAGEIIILRESGVGLGTVLSYDGFSKALKELHESLDTGLVTEQIREAALHDLE